MLTAAKARILLLRHHLGASTAQLARQFNISSWRVRWWINRHMSVDPSEILENAALKHEVVILANQVQKLERYLRVSASVIKRMQPNPRKRSIMGSVVRAKYGLTRTATNKLIGVSPKAGCRKVLSVHGKSIVEDMKRYFAENPGQGFKKMFSAILEGQPYSEHQLQKIYWSARLRVGDRKRRAPKQPTPARIRKSMPIQGALNEMWSMDYMTDVTTKGRRFWVLNIIDDFNREALVTEVSMRRSTKMVVACLSRLQSTGRVPRAIRSDNAAEFKGLAYVAWAKKAMARRVYIRPRSPTENSLVEKFNSTMRQEVLDRYLLTSMEEAGRMLEDWRVRYNLARPHYSLGGLSPLQYSAMNELKSKV